MIELSQNLIIAGQAFIIFSAGMLINRIFLKEKRSPIYLLILSLGCMLYAAGLASGESSRVYVFYFIILSIISMIMFNKRHIKFTAKDHDSEKKI